MQIDIHPGAAAGTPPWGAYPITEEADRCPPAVALWSVAGISAVLWWGGISLVQMAV